MYHQPKMLHYTLINNHVGLNWYAMCRLTAPNGKPMLDKDLLDLMFRAGCRKLSFGVESFDLGVSGDYEKKADPETCEELLRLVDEAGMINRVFLMLGYNDSPKSVEGNLRGLLTHPVHEVRISILTPFPGTPFFDECERERLRTTTDWTYHTGDYSILKPRHFAKPSDLMGEREKLFRDFMNSPEYKARLEEKVTRNPWFREGINEYFDFLRTRDVLS